MMNVEDWWKYIENEKDKYKKIGNIKCPAFSNEEVYFNHHGLNHLMYKDGILRPRKDILDRFSLLIFVPNIIKKIKSVEGEERRIKENSQAYFWTIKHKVHHNLSIRIILRRLNNGVLHFFSVMRE